MVPILSKSLMKENKKIILITGVSGFIGAAEKFLNNQFTVIGIDNMNSYYDPKLKEDRLKDIQKTLKDILMEIF